MLLMTASVLYAGEDDIRWTTGEWDADSLGNHRVVLVVEDPGEAVFCHIPWRRKDQQPEAKEIFVMTSTGQLVKNVIRVDIRREYGQVIFEPMAGAGTYYLYHMPYTTSGSRNYPTVSYKKPVDRCDAAWKKAWQSPSEIARLPRARVTEIQSAGAFHSFYPMEVIATAEEVATLLSQHPDKSYLLFPEDRLHPVKMWTDLPERWVKRPWQDQFSAQVRQNESFAFQIGLYAARQEITGLGISYSDLTSADGHRIPSIAMNCYNLTGTDWTGEPLLKEIRVKLKQIQPLWFGLMVPEDAHPGIYKGEITLFPQGGVPQALPLWIEVLDEKVADHGDSQPELHSRLRWLDSQIGQDHAVIPPYTPVRVENNRLHILGRVLTLAPNGLPEQITGSYNQAVTEIVAEKTDMLFEKMRLLVRFSDGQTAEPEARGIQMVREEEGLVSWTAKAYAGDLQFRIRGSLEADGFLGYEIEMESLADQPIEDVSLVIRMNPSVAEYMLGLGRRGGSAPEYFDYHWDPYFNNEGPWIGTTNLGLQCAFRDEAYERPLNTNFYQQKPLHMPRSWANGGKGAIRLSKTARYYEIRAESGQHQMTRGEVLHFHVQFLITPFHPIDTRAQWSTRYYHRYEPIDSILAYGGNTINVHHATEINPFINYPFMTPDIMKDYVDEAHEKGARVKLYYTVRELSNICPEIWALKSLGNEILSYGPGGGYSWLQEHLDGNYIAAWFVPDIQDAAVINSGVSRWHNYYLEGLNWLVQHIGMDGLYIDDVAFDRSVMKRVRKILKRGNPNALIDLHSANQFNHRDGFANSANLYLEHFAYIDRLWFGEYFDYDAGPDYWMTEVAGIPFGVMGEMLWEGGNPWRGLLYGMTSRAPWSGDPAPIWKAWDDFGMDQTRMIGYWVDDCPVQTGRPDVLATVYQADKKALIALASWAAGPARIRLNIDWEALGIDPDRAVITMPAIKDFQESGSLAPGETFQIPEGKGFILIIHE